MIHKLITLLLLCTLLLSMVGFAAEDAAISTISSQSDAPLLLSLGITEESVLSKDSVSRMEFLKSALKLTRLDCLNFGMLQTVGFTDVAPSQEDYSYVKSGVAMGIVSDGALFYPEEPITYTQALKILVGVVGLSEYAAYCGGYPYGYIKAAKAADITDGISAVSDTVSPELFTQLLVNTLNCNPSKLTGISDGEAQYASDISETIMQRSFDLYKSEGMVEANSCTTLYSVSDLAKNEVKIADAIYKVGATDADEWLGINAEFYYQKPDGSNVKTLIYIHALKDENRIYTIDPDWVEESSLTATALTYTDEKDKSKTLSLSATATYIYNDVVRSLHSISSILNTAAGKSQEQLNLMPKIGKLVLIDNNDDGVIELIKVTAYSSDVAVSVNSDGTTIGLRSGKSLDLGEERDIITVKRNGETVDATEIAADNTLSYYQTEAGDKQRIFIAISDRVVTEEISECSEDTVRVGNEEFGVSPAIAAKIQVGVLMKLWIDVFGNVADCISMDDVYVYGWLKACKKGSFDSVEARIFTQNAHWVSLEFNESIRCNAGKLNKSNWYRNYLANGSIAELVRYKVNSDAQITELYTAEVVTRWSDAEQAAIDNDTFRLCLDLTNPHYRGGTNSIDADLYLDANVKVFSIPTDTALEKSYQIINISDYFDYDETISKVQAYDMSRSGVAKAVVVGQAMLGKTYDDFMILDRFSDSENDEEEENYRIVGFFRGNEVRFPTADRRCIDKNAYKQGDFIKLSFDANGEVNTATKIMDSDLGYKQKLITTPVYEKKGFTAGEIIEVDLTENRIAVDYGSGTAIYTIDRSKFYSYDTEKNELTQTSAGELTKGAYVFIRVNYLVCQEIVIFQ